MEKYAYGRVSSKDQNLDRQVDSFHKLNIPDKNIFLDKASGKNFERKEYKRLLRKLKPNDLLYIPSITRLGRNYSEIIEQWRLLTKEKCIDIVVLDMPLLDTRGTKDLMGTFIKDLVLYILCFCAQNERENIKKTQAEGIKAAKERGVKFGRERIMHIEDFLSVYHQGRKDGLTNSEIIRQLPISESTFYRYLREIRKDKPTF